MKISAAALAVFGMTACSSFGDIPQGGPNGAYETEWIQKYGEVPAGQKWDFSDPMPVVGPEKNVIILPEAPKQDGKSASGVVAAQGETGYYYDGNTDRPLSIEGLKPVITLGEIAYLKTAFAPDAQEPLDWDPNVNGVHDFWPYYLHTPSVIPTVTGNYITYSLGLNWVEPNAGSYNAGIIHDSQLPVLQMWPKTVMTNSWYAGDCYNGRYGGYRFHTEADRFAGMEDLYWCAWNSATDNFFGYPEECKLEKYVEVVTPTGAKYWGFDCNHDGDYSDLVVLVDPSFKQTKSVRYMIEDLGSVGDFDFNDIVVDVYQERTFTNVFDGEGNPQPQYGPWTQTATVRCLGGTLDFELRIGNTTWRKSDHFDVAHMENSFDPDVNLELAKFTVTGWNPDTHNISVNVGNSASDGVKVVTFPKAGEVPMIIAFSTTQKWMNEATSIPAAWFTVPEE